MFWHQRVQNKDSPEQVFERADKALYQSKHAGRNHCTLFKARRFLVIFNFFC